MNIEIGKKGFQRGTIDSRFWAKVKKTESCWIWTGGIGAGGYGTIDFDGKTRKAHRVSWIINNGPIVDGKYVLHICDNPPCVRPDHLKLGTQRENIMDMDAKGRRSQENKTRGSAHWKTKLTENEVLVIREMHKAGEKQKNIAARFGITGGSVLAIVVRRTWRHI